MAPAAPSPLALSARPMSIVMRVTKTERGLAGLLTWLARHNAELLRERPDLPLLYDSGVRYEREEVETWSDYLATLEAGHEDCDALAAARAGELLARGHRALTEVDGGFDEARRLRLPSIPAWVVLRTKGDLGLPNLYHCIVLYRVGNTWWRDDPSARLGMLPTPRHPYPDPAAPLPGPGFAGVPRPPRLGARRPS